MANKFTLTITAVDKATAVVRGVNQSIAKMTSPVTGVRSSFKSLNKEIGQNPLVKGASKLDSGIGKAFGQVGKFIPELGEIGGMAGEIGAVAGAFGLVGGAAAAAIVAVGAIDMKFAGLGFTLRQTSLSLGMSTQAVQGWHGAAGLMGVDAKTVDASFQQMGDTIQDATMGRNQQALMFMNRLGITLKRTATGAVDVNDEMLQLSDVIKKYNGNPETQRLIARQFGVEGMLPALRGGRKQLEGYLKDQKKWALSDKEVEDANKFHLAMAKTGAVLKGVTVKVFSKVFDGSMWALRGLRDGFQGVTQFVGDIWNGLVSLFDAGLQKIKGLVDGVKAIPGKVAQGAKDVAGKAVAAAKAAGGWIAHEGGAILNGLGIKRNNPGNIRPLSGQGFNTYATLGQGLAAMGRQLQIYQDKHHLSTIAQIVSRWAPPSDHNDTAAYIRNVAARTGFGANQALNLHDPRVLAAVERAMIKQEHGKDIGENDILAAIGAGGAGANGVRAAGGSVDVNVKVQHDGRSATVKTASTGVASAKPPRVERSLTAVPA